MAAKQIYECDIPALEYCYGDFSKSSGSSLSPVVNTHHPDLGAFKISNLVFPQMFLFEMQWHIPDALVIHETRTSPTIDINFVLAGHIRGEFNGLKADFGLHGGYNNLKYTPSEKSRHHACRQDAEMFVVALDKHYFLDLIGCDDPWSEMILHKMDREENFLASKAFVPTTPQMHALIESIRYMQPGPMSRLLTQSMVFELLAHQLGQLRTLHNGAGTLDSCISIHDSERLYVVKQYIEQHFLDALTLTDLSRVGMLNEFKLKKGFKTLFGTSVIQYVKQLRMQHAQILLRDHGMRIEEVSVLLGYLYPNHFSAAYKKHFGMVPSLCYRRLGKRGFSPG